MIELLVTRLENGKNTKRIELLVTRLENGKNTKSNLYIQVDDNC